MPARIYALAKELKLDSKVLVDLCAQAGVAGKGSALASLTDEEVDKVKSYVASKNKPAAAPVAKAPGAPIRPTTPPTRPTGVPHIAAPVRPATAPPIAAPVRPATAPPATPVAPTASAAPPPAASAPPEATPPAATPPAAAPPPAPKRPAAPQPPAPIRREDYMAPGGVTGRPPALGSRVDRSEAVRKRSGGDSSKPSPPRPGGPGIRLAQMPSASQPTAPAKSDEPAPQKPDIKLPVDAIRASKAGSKPLQEHLRKHEAKRKADSVTPKGKDRGRTDAPLDDAATTGGKHRKARGKAVAEDREPVEGRGGPGGPRFGAALGGREQRQLQRKRTGSGPSGRRRGGDDDGGGGPRRRRLNKQRSGASTAAPRKGRVVVEFPATVRSFSEALGIPVKNVLGKLLALGTMSNIAAPLDVEMGELLAVELGVEIDIKRPADPEDQLLTALEEEDAPEDLQPRPPVVTFLGHVDHGKTSLLDRIIGIDVVSGESGGITQHIRAYRIDKDGRSIAFVDTPGHEAFTEMRARGANVTDIAVLVVAADDGLMPQTEEAISHARAAGVPIVVALNKIDLPGVDVQRIFQQLATAGLLPSEWGGDTEVVRTSAITGDGIDDLLEMLVTMADLNDYRANPNRPAIGTCLEAELHEGRGVVAKVIVENGTLKVGDVVVCGPAYGRIKAMYDTLDGRKTYKEVGPSTPVNLTGLDVPPGAGDHFYVLDDISQVRTIAEKRTVLSRQNQLGGITSHVTLETLHERLTVGEVKTLNMILRADVRGSIEAIQKELTKLEHAEVQIKILQATVGGVSEADVHLADASDAVIIAFNVVPDEGARALADQRGVQVRRYDIIYQVTEDLRKALEGMLEPEKQQVDLGRALVKRTFTISRLGTIAGCQVLAGVIERNSRIRVIRDNRIIGEYALESLKREKDDTREVRSGYECGMKLSGYNDLKEGDILEAYKVQEVARTF